MHLRDLPHSAGACSVLGYMMKLWRIRSLTTTSPDAEAAVRLLQGGSQTQTIWPGCLQGPRMSSAPPHQGLCRNGISEHTGRATYLCLKAAEEPSSFPLPPHPGLQSPAPGRSGEGRKGSEGKGWPECRRQFHKERKHSSFCPCPQSCRSPLG